LKYTTLNKHHAIFHTSSVKDGNREKTQRSFFSAQYKQLLRFSITSTTSLSNC